MGVGYVGKLTRVDSNGNLVVLLMDTEFDSVYNLESSITAKIIPVRKTAAEFEEDNEVLPRGCRGYESDTSRLKIGDGVTPWNLLGYIRPV